MNSRTVLACVGYVVAVATANVLVAKFGPTISIFNAFALIGLVLVLRDKLHLEWGGDPVKMFSLIAAGGIVGAVIAPASARIAMASCVAFIASELVDYAIFKTSHGSILRRSNISNVTGAAVDSLIFPALAFGAWLPLVVLGQFAAKSLGGAIWSWLIFRRRPMIAAATLLLALSRPATAGWIADIGVGAVAVEGGYSAPVVEVFTATPALAGFRLYGIAAADLEAGTGDVDTAVLAATRGWFTHGCLFALNAGATWFKFEDFDKAHPFVGATFSAPVVRKLRLVLTGSVDRDGVASGIAKITVPIL